MMTNNNNHILDTYKYSNKHNDTSLFRKIIVNTEIAGSMSYDMMTIFVG